MALIYTKTIDTGKYLLSENNNIIEFTDNVASRSILYAEFKVGNELPSRVYADLSGVIWYNVNENVSPRLNDYADTLNLSSVNVSNIDSYFLDWSKTYLEYNLDINVVFSGGGGALQESLTGVFVLGVEQVMDYFKEMTIKNNDMFVLGPLKKDTNNTHYLKYWNGYPFDFGFTENISTGANITVIENLSTQQSTLPLNIVNKISRMVVSDGTSNVSIENHLPLPFGLNVLKLGTDTIVELNKVDSNCGAYIKWLNQYGGYSYWLFENSSEKVKSKQNGFINNDFYNIEESVSGLKSAGRTSEDTLQVYYEYLTEDDINLLTGVLSSPKIYLYMGYKFAKRPINSWIEVSLSSNTVTKSNFKNRVPNGMLTFNLPSNKTISL